MTGSEAQKWADAHNMQTLTTVMGPLMEPQQPHCDRGKKSWSRYVHGASAIFAWCIAQGQSVIMLSPPPPERFHPSGLSYFQLIEEPIIKGTAFHEAPCWILMVHPRVKGAENVCYEIWPHDSSSAWIERFGLQPGGRNWRQTGNETFTNTGRSTVCTPLAAEEKPGKKAKRAKKLKISSKNQALKAKGKRLEPPKKIAELKREKKACAEKKSATKTEKPKAKKKKKAKSEKKVEGYTCPSNKRVSALPTGSKSQP
ncbi:uncharacterized protein BDW43DRAFT_316421 [Aspergillus alliaceus]|uniref:uncharacterized protein n=1 Tax=Petromyces alliaceus TaxID=209559 RepID=UPI0012A6203A|nr:uncharacterized protein BDW43DRAFT_316421 [Aspergillus alliaceus]KAB8227911.1 hypothetical protein BDW43DRAFT_316421 [Aspergillus alliaceus]